MLWLPALIWKIGVELAVEKGIVKGWKATKRAWRRLFGRKRILSLD